jgi:hypothetical protein
VSVSKVKLAWANIAQNVQQNMMSIPSRLSALVAGEIRTQGTMLIEKFDAGTTVTRADLVKWLDCLCDEKVVSDLMMMEVKKILQALSGRQSWELEQPGTAGPVESASAAAAAIVPAPAAAAPAGTATPGQEA